MKVYKFYMTDVVGGFNGYDRQKVWVDTATSLLHIGRTVLPLAEITACEVRPLPLGKGWFLAIDVCGPSINDYQPTTIRLIHKNFFGVTKQQVMLEAAAEIQPLIKGNIPLPRPLIQSAVEQGKLQAQYTLNISLLIGLYRKQWYSYDTTKKILLKTTFLMLLGGVINIFGVLLLAVPYDNYQMSKNLTAAGWSRRTALITYALTTVPVYVWWAYNLFH